MNVGGALLFPACPSVRGHSNSLIFNQIYSKFHVWIASINFSFKFEYGFCPLSDNQDGGQNGRHISISAVMVTLTQSFLIGFLPNFIYGLLQILYMDCFNQVQYGFCPTSDNQDGPHISISAVVVTLTQSFLIGFLPNFIYGLLPSTSHSSSNTGFVRRPLNKMADKMASTYQYPLSWSL